MIRNYFLVAVRNLTRNKFFSAINIFGLAVSMSIGMAIIMLVADQMMYDRSNTKRDRIFRVISRVVTNSGVERGGMDNATAPMPLREELQENYTGIEKVVRFKRGFGNNWMELEGQNVNIPLTGFFADPEVLEVFEFALEYGDIKTALVHPYSVVLTKKAARKLFKEENPLGLTLKVGELGIFTVTGVLKETQNKSHIVFEGLASMATVKSMASKAEMQAGFRNNLDNWSDFWNGWTYVLIEKDRSKEDIKGHLDDVFLKHIATFENPETYRAKFHLQSLTEITPGQLMNNSIGPSLPWVFVYFLGGLAAVIMLTSCFNFTNLSIARSLTRAREIGVRKVTGAARWQIFVQFLSESILVAFLSLIIACALLLVIKPLMLQLNFARVFQWDLQANYAVYAVFVLFALAVGILAGLFPAIVLSGLQPVKVLKRLENVKMLSKIGLRKAIIVVQFTLSLIFILSVIVLHNQLDLFMGKDHGFSMNSNIAVKMNNTSVNALKTELLKYGNIRNAAGVSHVPASGTTYGDGFKKSLEEKAWTNVNYFLVDEDYLKNIEVDLVAGSFFTAEAGAANKNHIIINEEAIKAFHYPSAIDAIGEEVIYQADSTWKTIIGVVKDYNHQFLMAEISPMALMYNPDRFDLLQVKYSGTYEDAATTIEKAWTAVNPQLKADYNDFEAEIKEFYQILFGDLVNILGVISVLAIVISCLGLLGMATYATETKRKEISIRKVLGSTDQALVLLLSKGFLNLIWIAIVIGVPMAWFINNLWLELIAYRTSFSPLMILTGIGILLLLGVVTIGSQTLRAAFTNPVDNLKNE
ncbi:MAG: FtsX-like permease family protein [Cyclobacteriaceae bacterium]